MKQDIAVLNSTLILKAFVRLLLITNLLIYFLRTMDSEWWSFDYQIYKGVEESLHLRSILYFCVYLFIYFFILRHFFSATSRSIEKRDLRALFRIVVLLFSIQVYLAIFMNIGIAGGTGKAPAIVYFLLLFSFDGVYYAYALQEKNKNRLLWATFFYIFSNIVRGWAGFVVFLGVIYLLRRGHINKNKVLMFIIIFFSVIPFLFVVRDFFRGGYSQLDILSDSGLHGVNLYYEYFLDSLNLILIRFDFYSHYIGVSGVDSADLNQMCQPIQENIFYKIYLYFNPTSSCISLGSILPGSLYDFFKDKGTSYSISSGFFGLPFISATVYFFSYIFILFIFSIFVKNKMIKSEYASFFIVLVFLLLLQGWMYQFIHNILGFILGWVLSNVRWRRKSTNAMS